MTSANTNARRQDSKKALEEAYSYPDEKILGYIFSKPGDDRSQIEALIKSNYYLGERVDDMRAFLEVNDINTIEEYKRHTTRSSDAFLDAFSFALAETEEHRQQRAITKEVDGVFCSVCHNLTMTCD
jgi:hypothetical protein